VIIGTIAYVYFWKHLLRLFPALRKRSALGLFFIVWLASIKPIHASFQCFNIQVWVAALLLGAEVWTRSASKGWQWLAGFVVMTLAAVKVYPVFVLVYYLIVKSPSVRWGALAAALVAVLVPVPVFGFPLGFQLTYEFAWNLLTYHHPYPLADGTYLLSLPALFAWVGKLWNVEAVAILFTKGLVTLLTVGFYFHVWRHRDEEQLPYWSLAMALMVLLNSVTRVDYFICFVPAFAMLAQYRWEKPKLGVWYTAIVVAAFLLMCGISEWTVGGWNHRLEAWRVPVYGMLALCGLLGWTIWREENGRVAA
jgi:hypothetical protein